MSWRCANIAVKVEVKVSELAGGAYERLIHPHRGNRKKKKKYNATIVLCVIHLSHYVFFSSMGLIISLGMGVEGGA